MKIFDARREHIQSIVKIQVDSWQTAYRGLIPNEFLKTMTYEANKKRLEHVFNNRKERHPILVGEHQGEVFGFASGGANRFLDQTPEYDGELMAIYVKPGTTRQGFGQALFAEFKQRLKEDKYSQMAVRTVIGNAPAINFYKKLGGTTIVEKLPRQLGDFIIYEVCFGWKLN